MTHTDPQRCPTWTPEHGCVCMTISECEMAECGECTQACGLLLIECSRLRMRVELQNLLIAEAIQSRRENKALRARVAHLEAALREAQQSLMDCMGALEPYWGFSAESAATEAIKDIAAALEGKP